MPEDANRIEAPAMLLRHATSLLRCCGLAAAALTLLVLLPLNALAAHPVASVTMVIGSVQAVDAQGKTRRLAANDTLAAGEHIETAGNGHVHLRFIDDARISVRPNSRLAIHTYDYDAAAPERAAIRLELEEGIVRSITGRGAERARERFRFNTPLAAIGVRGTDFQVHSGLERVRVMVNEGAIVMSAFSESCPRDSLGPCLDAGVLLEGGSEEVLELLRNQSQPQRLQSAVHEAIGTQRSDSSAFTAPAEGSGAYARDSGDDDRNDDDRNDDGSRDAGTLQEGGDVPQDGDAPQEDGSEGGPATPRPPEESDAEASDDAAAHRPEENAGESTEKDIGKSTEESAGKSREGSLALEPDSSRLLAPDDLLLPPRSSDSLPPVAERQLAWGHWDSSAHHADFVLAQEDAARNRTPRAHIDGLTLYRAEEGGATLSTTHLGSVDFLLDAASVTLRQGQDVSPMATTGGGLNVRFGQREFTTALDLEHEATGPLRFLMEGDVSASGTLIGISNGGALVGSTSLDGKEAAYYFQQLIDQGQITGLTLWGAE